MSRNKKNNVYPCKPQFYYIKVGFKEIKIIKVCFRDGDDGCPRRTKIKKCQRLSSESQESRRAEDLRLMNLLGYHYGWVAEEQCLIIFIAYLQSIPPLPKHIFVTFYALVKRS